ncbi:M48 family metallopeptidase [Xanthovirga aplysinae]|uniref:M48 family metallopeptidase n=1 Tax=Xanthovirga aplysinae TaxID=2529853 RepID=UPI0012BC8E46|nr:M48 family metallopeptidase [Xanthovirga aplysinae]MTI30123.1 M48 family peptidase [Xanthovirga aplysinae]
MEPTAILWIILGLITFNFVFDQVVDLLNRKAMKDELPDALREFYEEEKYRKSVQYHRTKDQFSVFSSSFSFILSILVIGFGLLGYLDSWLRPLIQTDLLLSLSFFGILYLASDLLTIPFQLYNNFVIEEKFGFNKMTLKIFFTDKLKGYLIAAVLGSLIIGALIYLIQSIGANFWLWFWGIISLFILMGNMFYTSLIVPLFNKLSPLEEGDLKSAIKNYCSQVNFPLENIYVIDGSKRSTKANAFFSGIGKKKKVVFYDTLIEKHSTEELVAVFAHEVGHYKKKHIISSYILSILQTGLMLWIMSLMIFNENLSLALGGKQTAIHLNLVAFALLYSPISMISGLFMNQISRKNEYEADAFATQTYKGSALQLALKKLSVENLSNLLPHPLYVFIHYSHPTLLQRLAAIDQENRKNKE